MSSPILRQSLDDAGSQGAGSDVRALGHHQLGLFVSTDATPTSLKVQLEISPTGTEWAVAETLSGELSITEADLNAENNAHISAAGVYAELLRANVTAYDAAGNVDAWIMVAGNAGQGRKGVGRNGPVSDL